MIETRTALCVIAAVASGLFLFSEKRQALMIDREIGGLRRTTADLHTQTALLRAEWASLLGPDQLGAMVSAKLTLQPIVPSQFVPVSELGAHLPPPGSPASASTDDDAAVAGSADEKVVGSEPAPAAAAPPASPAFLAALPPSSATHGADMRPAGVQQPALAPAAAKPLAKPPVRRSLPQHSLALASLAPPGQNRLKLAPRPVVANTYKAIARPAPALPAAAPVWATRPAVGSALGGGMALPPPVPYGQ